MMTQSFNVTSADGTLIAGEFTRSGSTMPVLTISPALADRSGNQRLCRELSTFFTAVNYDRRGRGDSSQGPASGAREEVGDIEAIIDAFGGQALLFGSSSGAVLALEAAAALGHKVLGVVAYEPPVIVEGSREAVSRSLAQEIDELVAQGQPGQAVARFHREAIGVPAIGVALTRLMVPMWKSMVELAPTISTDLRLCAGLQDARPLEAHRFAGLRSPSLIIVGKRSEAFMHTGCQALVDILPGATLLTIPGAHHGTPLMNPRKILPATVSFLLSCTEQEGL